MKKKQRMVINVSFLLLFILPSLLHAENWEGKVISVLDGDTIIVLKSNKKISVRLAAIDCPEKGQAWNQEAKQFTSDMVLGKVVKVVPLGQGMNDPIIAWVIIDEKNLSMELLKAGLAWYYKKHGYNKTIANLEFEVRSAEKGLWASSLLDRVAPWDFREGRRPHRSKQSKDPNSGGASKKYNGEIIGQWIDRSVITPGKTTLLKRSGRLIMIVEWKDGSRSEWVMTARKYLGGVRLDERGGNPRGEYYVIQKGGSLAVYDEYGLIVLRKPIR